ncbi:YciI family protein [Aneurinibacillus uraniidurans]|uniref:YciI family protein n=1 Tax=Aneurinibacillus uraniidurans TaxID=2966586 RepID=UPI00234A9C39|nr:YciI family protein [Aneurinibacillus sp. B1]WCN39181.1 YciI family protein [Aneurinibacillus sp. B1]
MFLVVLKYIQPLEKVEAYLEEHVAFLNKYYEQSRFIFSGRRNPRTGGVILANVNTEAEIQAIIKEDPFYVNEIAEYDVIEFIPTKYDENFEVFIKN